MWSLSVIFFPGWSDHRSENFQCGAAVSSPKRVGHGFKLLVVISKIVNVKSSPLTTMVLHSQLDKGLDFISTVWN